MKRAILTGLFLILPTCLTWAKRELKKRGLSLIPLRSALGSSPKRPIPFDRGDGSSFLPFAPTQTPLRITVKDLIRDKSAREVFKSDYLHAWCSLKIEEPAFYCGCCTKIFNYQHQIRPGAFLCKWCYLDTKGGKFYQGKDMSRGATK